MFGTIAGYDPAVPAFAVPPKGRYNLVTCLDVLDKVEARFLDAVLADVAASTGGLALFDCLTLPNPASGLWQHRPFCWTQLVRRHMQVTEESVEFPGMQDFERVLIMATARNGG